MPNKNIAVIGTFDTKIEAVFFIEKKIRKRGCTPILIDVGPLTPPEVKSDFSNEAVARLAGWKLPDLIKAQKRDEIMAAMGTGAARVLLDLLQKNRLNGVLGIGGNQGTTIASMAMRGLPIGLPKFLVSTVASGNIRPYIGHKDISVMFSVADLLGEPNLVSRSVLNNAVSALVGMVEHCEAISMQPGEKAIALSALGNTEASAHHIMERLNCSGYQVITFHASGAGGTAMEELIEAGMFSGIVDLTPHELSEEVVGEGAYVPVKPGRMNAAARAGIPQVISTGALEYLCFGPWESIPLHLRRRKVYLHNPYNANVKVSRNEMKSIGQVMARRLNRSKGPAIVLVPQKGWSTYGSKGGPLYDPKNYACLLNALKSNLNAEIPYREVDLHINDRAFADMCVDSMLQLLLQESK